MKDYSRLDPFFPENRAVESFKWLRLHGFEKKTPFFLEKRIFMEGALDNHPVSVDVFAYYEPPKRKEKEGKWWTRIAKNIPNRFHKFDSFDSKKHVDVRDCLMESMDAIERMKKELEELVKKEGNHEKQ